jgi:uncharacterized delta-60 repeat protein
MHVAVTASLLALGLIFSVPNLYAAAGSLDPTFGSHGIAEASFGHSFVPADAVVEPADGKILVANSDGFFEVARFQANGSLDTSFGSGGRAIAFNILGGAYALALQSDGKIVAAGQVQSAGVQEFALARFNHNGNLDTSFGSGGQVITNIGFPGVGEAVLVQPDGKILLGGTVLGADETLPDRTALVRYNPDGSLDTTFGNGGTVSVVAIQGVTTLALLSSGDIVVLHESVIAQFSSTGSLRSSVTGGTIIARAGSGGADVFQSDGKYVLAQTVNAGLRRCKDFETQVIRFTSTGGVDSTFKSQTFDFTGEGGCSNFDTTSGAAIQSDGKIVLSGTHSVAFSNTLNVLVRLNSNGSFDTTFGANGIVTNNLPAGTSGLDFVLIQPDGKILAIGMTNGGNDITLARYLAQ